MGPRRRLVARRGSPTSSVSATRRPRSRRRTRRSPTRCAATARRCSGAAWASTTSSCRRSSASGSPPARPAGRGARSAWHSATVPRVRSTCTCRRARASVAGSPYWWFHRHDVERKRADTLREVAAPRRPAVLAGRTLPTQSFAANGCGTCAASASGPSAWRSPRCSATPTPSRSATSSCATRSRWALAGEARSDDERMVELLAPYDGERGRVAALLGRDGWRAPALAPGLALIPIARL